MFGEPGDGVGGRLELGAEIGRSGDAIGTEGRRDEGHDQYLASAFHWRNRTGNYRFTNERVKRSV